MHLLADVPRSVGRQKLDHQVVIGKDILELLSNAMYVDPLCIYREYIQNATDAIDEARVAGLYAKGAPPRIDIALDRQQRSIKIRDNGIAVAPNVFARRLTALGASKKRGSGARGFRGVGRLGGLAYCQKLIFRSKVKSFPRVWEIHWDCVRLKALLRDHTYDGDLHDIMSEIVGFDTVPAEGFPAHFFEVELQAVNRIKNDLLLNESLVEAYLAQVAPVPFSDDFSYGPAITEYLERFGAGQTYDLFLNDRCARSVRPFRDEFSAKQKLEDRFNDITYFDVPGIEGELDAIGWVLHHSYFGALPERAGIRGLRLRAGNMQIGDEALFDSAFPESRFNGWSVGEVHLISKRIVPNGRRDDIEYSAHQQNLLKHVMPIAKQITKLSRRRSAERQKLQSEKGKGPGDHAVAEATLTPKQLTIVRKLHNRERQAVLDCVSLVTQAVSRKDTAKAVITAVLKHISTRRKTAKNIPRARS